MERTTAAPEALSSQMKRRAERKAEPEPEDNGVFVSTGSTLLDLAISGGRRRGGGLPGGILVEVFGPSGCGKTVLLCEVAGRVQRQGGKVMFQDPEARLNTQYSQIFGLRADSIEYGRPTTVVEAFKPILNWKPPGTTTVHGVFTDSLAALSTELEMENEAGDKMGMRRAKEFSEQLRKVCRVIASRNILTMCSNQVRSNPDAGQYGPKFKSPGGEAIGFYSSLRLRCKGAQKIKKEKHVRGEKVVRTIGVETEIEVFKSTIWKPYRQAKVYILFDYGVDVIRGNLQFVKDFSSKNFFSLGRKELDRSLEGAIRLVEEDGLQKALKEEVIDLWEEVENTFDSGRTPRARSDE